MEFYRLQQEMFRLFRCRTITNNQVHYLETLIHQHNRLYQKLFRSNPDRCSPAINKFHHFLHYCSKIFRSGPAVLWETIRFEAMHHLGKLRMSTSSNYTNVPYTIAKRSAINMAYNFTYHEEKPKFDPMSCEIEDGRYIGEACIFENISFLIYQTDMVLCLKVLDVVEEGKNLPLFGIIDQIIYEHEKLFFQLSLVKTVCYDSDYCAYKIKILQETQIISVDELFSKYPLALWANVTVNTNEPQHYFIH